MPVDPYALRAEAYASAPSDVKTIVTLAFDHPELEAPLYFARGVDVDEPGATVELPLEDGSEVAHLPCAFGLTRTGYDDDGATDGKVMVDNIASQMSDVIRAMRGYNSPIQVTIREYEVGSGGLAALTAPVLTLDGLVIYDGGISEDGLVSLTLTYPDARIVNVPTGADAFFDRQSYPGLY